MKMCTCGACCRLVQAYYACAAAAAAGGSRQRKKPEMDLYHVSVLWLCVLGADVVVGVFMFRWFFTCFRRGDGSTITTSNTNPASQPANNHINDRVVAANECVSGAWKWRRNYGLAKYLKSDGTQSQSSWCTTPHQALSSSSCKNCNYHVVG